MPGDPEPADPLRRRLDRERRARREAETIAEDALRQLYETVGELQRSKAVLDETTDFVVIADLDGQARYMNKAFFELLGLENSAVAQVNVLDLLTPASRERFHNAALPALEEKGLWRGELALMKPESGSEIPVSQVLIGHRDARGALDSMSSISRDITDRLAMEQQLTHLALHDPLTGLPNRRLFSDRLDIALARCQRTEDPVGVFFMDVDGFKAVNDALGHEAGDQVLVMIAARLVSCLRPSDTVCRLGGDEFAVLCEYVENTNGALNVAARLGEAAAKPIAVAGTDVSVTASIGIVVTSLAPDGPEGLLRDADSAMYDAKRRGKAQARIFGQN